MLRLVGDVELKMCPECLGRGWVPCPMTVATRTLGLNGVPALQPGTGHPIPCPSCAGKKIVTNVG
jgi:DnaJ-class molecular chaperone